MVFGVAKLGFDDNYKNLFRSRSDQFVTLRQFLQDFPADETDLSLVFEANELLSRPVLAALQEITIRIEALQTVESVFSIFSVPKQSTSIRQVEPVLPDDLVNVANFEQLVAAAAIHPLVKDRLLSGDQRVTLAFVELSADTNSRPQTQTTLDSIHEIVSELGGGVGLQVHITGNPAIRVALKSQAIHDQIVFNSLGALLAGAIAYLLFRSMLISLVVSSGPIIGVLLTLGCMGFAGVKINVINQMIAPMIMVIGFTDAVHLMFSIQRQRRQGETRLVASLGAVREVGLACGLSSVTTAIGFGSLILSKSTVIQELALFAALGAVLTFLVVILLVPLVTSWLPDRVLLTPDRPTLYIFRPAPYRILADKILRTPAVIVSVGMLLTLVAFFSAFFLTTDFRFRENLPRGHEVSTALEIADTSLGGIQTLNVVVSWPDGATLDSPEVLRVIRETQDLLIGHTLTNNAVSILDVLEFTPGRAERLEDRVPRLVYVPQHLLGWLLNETQKKTLIVARILDSGARSQLPVLDSIEAQLGNLQQKYPDYAFTLTGITVAAARGSTEMIGDMMFSLMGAVATIFILLALALGSVKLGIISFLPNILPLMSIAAVLVWSGQRLQYATIMVFTICLGIVVDDTIHMLVRYRREVKLAATVEQAIVRTMESVGPVLVVTTMILIAGFCSLVSSATEVVVRMGLLSCLALVMALLADLIVLPALISWVYGERRNKAES